MIRRFLILLFLYICISIFPFCHQNGNICAIFQTCSFATETLKINSINFDNSDSIIFLGTSGGEDSADVEISKKTLSEPDRIFFDIDNAIITFPNSTYELKNSRLEKLKIAQNSLSPNVVRIVLWQSKNYDASQIKVLKIKKNIIIKLTNETALPQYLTQIYRETATSAVDYYDKAVIISEEKPQMEISDEIFNQVQQAFKDENKELVRPNIEQKQAKLKSRFFLENVIPKNGNILLSGIGVINIEKPFILSDPSRIVFDLPNTIVMQELRNKEIKISETQSVKIGQFEPSKARIVINTSTPELYIPIYSSNLQTLLLTNVNKVSGLNLTNTLSELSYFKEQRINTATNIINITFSNPIVYSIKREVNSISIIIYNLANFNISHFNQLAISNKTGFKAEQSGANTYKISFPVKSNTLVDCYESLNASQLRFVFTTQQQPTPVSPSTKEEKVMQKTEIKPLKLNTELLQTPKASKLNKKELSNQNKVKNKVIIIDPGHGGNDTGASRGDVLEKDLTLAIAAKVRQELRDLGFKNVYLTRYFDKTLALADRVDYANNKKADIFVSIHINSSVKSEINGIETHYYSEDGAQVAKIMHKELMSEISATDRGLFKSKFYVINHTEAPAVLLELGFISNEQERLSLMSNKRQNASARAIANGIYNYLMERRKND